MPRLYSRDPRLVQAITLGVVAVIGHRLVAARIRLPDRYAPDGDGEPRW